LSNERFVSNANPEVVARERKKLEDGISKLASVEEALARLN
jgi:valyl-tRNA synthetase